MKERMGNWSMFFKVVGWICVIGGIAALVFTMGLSAIAVVVGLCCWFTCAVLEWMDGLTDQLIESRELQQRQLTALIRIEEELVNARKQSERTAAQTGTTGADPCVRKAMQSLLRIRSRRYNLTHSILPTCTEWLRGWISKTSNQASPVGGAFFIGLNGRITPLWLKPRCGRGRP